MSEALRDPAPPARGIADPAAAPDLAVASQARLTWWAFRRHRLAMASLWVVGLLYLSVAFAGLIAPMDPTDAERRAVYHPPQPIHLIDRDAEGGWRIAPHVVAMARERDPVTLAITYRPTDEKVYLRLLGTGDRYRFWGLWETDLKLLAAREPGGRFYLLGADRLGRDMASRVVHGTRISLSIGLVGVAISLVLGVVLGGVSGYFGGWVDTAIQRLIEFVLSLPTIPIWLALAASLPPSWPIYKQYLFITVIVSLVGWTELGRVVRGRFLAMRDEEFVIAARLDGAREGRIILRHMLPLLTSHIIASLTLAVPLMILAETALSFLGLGLTAPAISWGVLLREAQNVLTISEAPWLLSPSILVVVSVLAFNFLGDGLRDAADPYGRAP